ncbi:transporter substrate-binding domain-containing protein [Streptomyces sp. CWNU-52B]|uniref:transporter substrate-binding domain-containing protein n=1 Tax=unclassified Streptomyces TaxID=2593676 RepID=UPI0039BF139E
MNARRMRASLRGWGGVGAMAVVCALAAVFALLLPRTQSGEDAGPTGAKGTAQGYQTKAGTCVNPQNQSLSPSSGDLDGKAVREIRERGKLIVGIDQNSFGWGYRDPNSASKNDQLKGFDIDLARAIAKDILGDASAIIPRAVPTNKRFDAVEQGTVDMVVRTVTINCGRLDLAAFSSPYFETGQQVLAPKVSDITGYDDSLKDKRLCSAKSSIASEQLEADKKSGRLPGSTDISTQVPNQLDCLVRLQLGEVDAVVTDRALAAGQIAQDPTVRMAGQPFTKGEYYGVIMKKDGASDLVRRVNKILEEYRKDGWQKSYDDNLEKYLGTSSGPPTDFTYKK